MSSQLVPFAQVHMFSDTHEAEIVLTIRLEHKNSENVENPLCYAINVNKETKCIILPCEVKLV